MKDHVATTIYLWQAMTAWLKPQLLLKRSFKTTLLSLLSSSRFNITNLDFLLKAISLTISMMRIALLKLALSIQPTRCPCSPKETQEDAPTKVPWLWAPQTTHITFQDFYKLIKAKVAGISKENLIWRGICLMRWLFRGVGAITSLIHSYTSQLTIHRIRVTGPHPSTISVETVTSSILEGSTMKSIERSKRLKPFKGRKSAF